MKKLFKKSLAVIMTVAMLLCALPLSEFVIEAEATTTASCNVGDIIEFGSYPQSEVTDSALIKKLNSQTLNWVSYSYYSGTGEYGSMKQGDFMKYADVTYNGTRYRAVLFTEYRPMDTVSSSSVNNSKQDDNGYYTNTVYWFIYEPLKWKVLDTKTGLVLSESIIDTQAYSNTVYYSSGQYYNNSACSVYANNYAKSSIRQWLNNDFYNTAFSAAEQTDIISTLVDNTAFRWADGSSYDESAFSIYDSTDTTDKIFLLSFDEANNPEYDFTKERYDYNTDQALLCEGTAYAKCLGLNEAKNGLDNEKYPNCEDWYLRTASYNSLKACTVTSSGYIEINSDANYFVSMPDGIRPAMCVEFPIQNNQYNLGEETYGFGNFKDSHAPKGHCFGMSVTSAGYYMGVLNVTGLGISSAQSLNTLSRTKTVICFYQARQTRNSTVSIVAGGTCYISMLFYNEYRYDINSDWTEVVNYVKNHTYDNTGALQIGFMKGKNGHAINFLYYAKVDGQDRIYAYDNNFPNIETYFYMDSSGNVRQAPKSIFNGSIDCICLRSIEKYFSLADSYDATRCIETYNEDVYIANADFYCLDGSSEKEGLVGIEVPVDAEQAVLMPLSEDAEFTYLGETYEFGGIGENNVGVLNLAETEGEVYSGSRLSIESVFDYTEVSINTPSIQTVNYGETLVLSAESSYLPSRASIAWTVDGSGVSTAVSADGTECRVTSIATGNVTVKATVVDENGEVITNSNGDEISDSIMLKSNAGFWQKIVSFFKNLFGVNRVIY